MNSDIKEERKSTFPIDPRSSTVSNISTRDFFKTRLSQLKFPVQNLSIPETRFVNNSEIIMQPKSPVI
jgi:hypothetical protein